jgi:tRNA (guanosine-2'-O-)-methyltransferase
VCESTRRRHNVSAILRSCEVFGVHEVHLVTAGFRPSPGASRHSERWVDLHVSPSTAEVVAGLRRRDFRVFVADLAEGAHAPESLPIDRPVALVFGSEFHGVSAEARALADGAVQIPAYGLTQSLNVSVAAAVLIRAVSERIRADRPPDLPVDAQLDFLRRWIDLEVEAKAGWLARTEPLDPTEG